MGNAWNSVAAADDDDDHDFMILVNILRQSGQKEVAAAVDDIWNQNAHNKLHNLEY